MPCGSSPGRGPVSAPQPISLASRSHREEPTSARHRPPARPAPAARPGSRAPQGACVGAALPPRCCPRAQTRAFLRGEPGPSPALGHLPSPRLSSSLSRCLSSVGRAFFIIRLLCLTTLEAAPLPFCEGSPWRWPGAPPPRRVSAALASAHPSASLPGGDAHRRTRGHGPCGGPQAAAAARPGHRRVSPPQPPLADTACKRCGRAVPGRLARPCRPSSAGRAARRGHRAVAEGQRVPGQGPHVRPHLAAACCHTACEPRTGFVYIRGRGNPATLVTRETAGSRARCHKRPFTRTHGPHAAMRLPGVQAVGPQPAPAAARCLPITWSPGSRSCRSATSSTGAARKRSASLPARSEAFPAAESAF